MRRFILLSVFALVAAALAVPVAWAGSPHFVGTPTATRDGDALTVSGKVAGLGDETQINVAVTADVACVNPGNNEPKAENKGAIIAEGTSRCRTARPCSASPARAPPARTAARP